MIQSFTAAILALWCAINPSLSKGPERLAIAKAIAAVHVGPAQGAVLLGEGHLHDALVEAYYAAKESEVRRFPVAQAWDAKAHVSCGFLQEPCTFVDAHLGDDAAQARWWAKEVGLRGIASVDSSPSRAKARVAWVSDYMVRVYGTTKDDIDLTSGLPRE